MKLPNFAKIKEFTLDILFPPLCLSCRGALAQNEKADALCAACFASITLANTFTCGECGSRLPNNEKICHNKVPYLLAAATRYSDAVPQLLIRRLKYECLVAAAAPLSTILSRYIDALNVDFSSYAVVPIPLHPKRLKERGFNQAELLAVRVAAKLQIPLLADALARVKHNKPQAELSERLARHENMAGCFVAGAAESVTKKNILLIDDVHTSGATIAEATRTLRVAGAKKIIALVVARAN